MRRYSAADVAQAQRTGRAHGHRRCNGAQPGLGCGTASAQVLLPGVDPGPIPQPNGGNLPAFEGRRRGRSVLVPRDARAPVHGAQRQARTSTSTPTRRTRTRSRARWAKRPRTRATSSTSARRSRSTLRGGSSRSASGSSGRSWRCLTRTPWCRWRRTSCRRAARPRRESVHGLLGRRLLLLGRSGPSRRWRRLSGTYS